MHDQHEPNSEFVEKLEWQIGREVRRRNRSVEAAGGTPPSRMKTLAVMGLMLVSMGIGAAAVAVAYQAKGNELRELLVSGFERRAELARQRVTLATGQLGATERRVALGTASQEGLLEGRFKVVEAEAQVKAIELQIEEVRITGREPLSELSSPMVSGRDFVGERLRIEMSVPRAALDYEYYRLRETEKRLSLGTADVIDVDVSRARAAEVEVAIVSFRRKIEIRQMFRDGKIDGVETELRVLEGDAEQRRKTLATKVELARKESERAALRVRLGTGQRVDLAETTLRVLTLETEMAKAELDLALVRRQLEQRRMAADERR